MGRVVLGFVTGKIGEKMAVSVSIIVLSSFLCCLVQTFYINILSKLLRTDIATELQIYFGISMGLEILFWLVPQFVVSAVAVAFLGFFLGPLFPAAVVCLHHVSIHLSAFLPFTTRTPTFPHYLSLSTNEHKPIEYL